MGKEDQLRKIEISNKELLDLSFFLYLITLLFLIALNFCSLEKAEQFCVGDLNWTGILT